MTETALFQDVLYPYKAASRYLVTGKGVGYAVGRKGLHYQDRIDNLPEVRFGDVLAVLRTSQQVRGGVVRLDIAVCQDEI